MILDDEKKAIRAIRRKCLDCSGGSAAEVEQCSVEECPLFSFRLGSVPEAPRKKKKKEDRSLLLPGV